MSGASQNAGHGAGGGHEDGRTGPKGPEVQERPSISELRARTLRREARIGTGWPVLDAVTDGIPLARTTMVRGPSEVRLQVLARLAAWAAGEGYPTVLASLSRTTDELWLAVGAGGLGLPPTALLETATHDAWVDARLRVLDLRVLGGPDAPGQVEAAVRDRMPSLLVVDDFADAGGDWAASLDLRGGGFDLQEWPRSEGCALVLGFPGMDDFSDWVGRGVLTVRLVPDTDLSRITVGAYTGLRRRTRVVLLRDGFLEAPPPGASLLRRPGVANVWEDRSESEILSFASALGSEVISQVWGREEDIGTVEH